MAGVRVGAWVLAGGQWKRRGRGTVAPPPPPATITQRFPGDPNATLRKRIFVGASVGSGGSNWNGPHATQNTVASHETAAGTSLGMHRTFFGASSGLWTAPGGSMFVNIRADHTAGRLPVVSMKFADWASAGSGGQDTAMDGIIAELESYSKITVLGIDHEPENDGKSSADWRAMQARFRARMNAYGATHGGIKRIMFVSILMSFTWRTGSGRTPDDWWAGTGVHDAVCVDHYAQPSESLTRQQWTSFVAWAVAKSTPVGVTECGLRRTDTTAATKLQSFFDLLTGGTVDCVLFSYFDSNQGDSTDGYILDDNYSLRSKFRALLKSTKALHQSDLGY